MTLEVHTRNTPGFERHQRRAASPNKEYFKYWLLPYGVWTLVDGTEVLFDRYYAAMWQRSPNGVVTAADMNVWYPWVKQDYFYNDGNSPTFNLETRNRLRAILRQWLDEMGIKQRP
jgi:hypothetical protein